ncbi:unnamed protein product [Gongylonema pulchrum]|uniref:BTB domain-containing protein n=1 Tax=Gongylonema pulchrum TaxID=637853 RepID=A0A183EC82_9BILA|nr:unnamed protein product [Gongylonema pulchrum]
MRYPAQVLDRSVFVNPGWLAELSTFFAQEFFGERARDELILDEGVSYDQFLELLRVVCYCPTRKPITSKFLFEFF